MVARKLGAENLGKVQYVEAVIAYFILFINLGIDTYGKREVALYRNDKEKLLKEEPKSFRQSRCGFKFSKCRNRKSMGISPGTCRNSRIKWS